jgi:hypothetical protein
VVAAIPKAKRVARHTYLRKQARSLLDLAATTADPEKAQLLRVLAADYLAQAEQAEPKSP